MTDKNNNVHKNVKIFKLENIIKIEDGDNNHNDVVDMDIGDNNDIINMNNNNNNVNNNRMKVKEEVEEEEDGVEESKISQNNINNKLLIALKLKKYWRKEK